MASGDTCDRRGSPAAPVGRPRLQRRTAPTRPRSARPPAIASRSVRHPPGIGAGAMRRTPRLVSLPSPTAAVPRSRAMARPMGIAPSLGVEHHAAADRRQERGHALHVGDARHRHHADDLVGALARLELHHRRDPQDAAALDEVDARSGQWRDHRRALRDAQERQRGAAGARPTVRGAAFLGIGAMVGAGIFALLGQAAVVAGSRRLALRSSSPGRSRRCSGYTVVKLGVRYPSSGGLFAVPDPGLRQRPPGRDRGLARLFRGDRDRLLDGGGVVRRAMRPRCSSATTRGGLDDVFTTLVVIAMAGVSIVGSKLVHARCR